jgi:hypothetical protein
VGTAVKHTWNRHCEYCRTRNNPFKIDYAPLWFAWYPVETNNGYVFLEKVHRLEIFGGWGNLAGDFQSKIGYRYYKHLKP